VFALSLTQSFGETPERVVVKFVEALNGKKFDQMQKLVKGWNLSIESKKMLSERIPTISIENLQAKVSGMSARVTMTQRLPGIKQSPTNESILLTKSGGSWLLVPEKDNTGMLNLVLTLCAGDPEAVFAKAKAAALSTQCTSNLKKLCLGIIMYAMDSDDILKLTAANWQTKIAPYVKNNDLLKCSVTRKAGTAYSFNSALSGIDSTRIAEPSKTVMLYEGKGGKLAFHPDGKAAVGFADGRVLRLTAAEAKKLRWKP
jgi:hypothetical protein